jgi:hypothetical protein
VASWAWRWSAKNVVLAAAYTPIFEAGFTKLDFNPPIKRFANFDIDADAFVRRVSLLRRVRPDPEAPDTELPSFALLLLEQAARGGLVPPRPLPAGEFLIDYGGGPRTFPTVSYHRVASGEVPAEIFAGKIVLVGATSPTLHATTGPALLDRKLPRHREVDEAVAVEVERPAGRVLPHLLRALPDLRPEDLRGGAHEDRVVAGHVRLADEQRHLRLDHPDVHPPLEAELAGPRRGPDLGMLREVLPHAAVEIVAELGRLVEAGQARVAAEEAGVVDLIGAGADRRALDGHGARGRAARKREQRGDGETAELQGSSAAETWRLTAWPR